MVLVRRYICAVVGLGLLLLGSSIAIWGFQMQESWGKFLIFLLLMIISELHSIQVNQSFLTVEFGFVYSSTIIFGPVPAAVMKALSTLFTQAYLRKHYSFKDKLSIILFNIGQYMISFFAGIGAYIVAMKILPLSMKEPFQTIIVHGSGILTYFIVNNLLIEAYIDIVKERKLFAKLFLSLLNDLSTYFIAVPMGVLIIYVYMDFEFYNILYIFIPYIIIVYIYRLYISLLATNRELTALYDVAATMTSTLNIDEVLKIVLESIENLAPWDTACLFIYQQNALVPVSYDGFPDMALENVKIKPGEGITGSSLLKGKGEIVNNCHRDPRYKPVPGVPKDTRSMLVTPLIIGNELIGAITLTSSQNYIYTRKHLTLMSILASQAAVAISNARLFDKTAQMAITDGLTKVYNYRYIYEELERQVNRVKRSGGIFSLIIIDVDHFKDFNDMYGHLIGDEILQNLAEVLKSNVREKDVVGRYGGEEFAIILPDTSSMEAVNIAERIRQTVEKTALSSSVSGKKLYITISAGVASYPDDALSVDDLVRKADSALLFGAKKEGRNKVVEFKRYMN